MKLLVRSCAIRLVFGSAITIAFVTAFLWLAYRASQAIPDFYQAALSVDPEKYRHEGDEFESKVFQLRNDLEQRPQWQATFTQDQINGWLASDLPEKFPDTLPSHVVEPRIALGPGLVRLAFRLESTNWSGVVIVCGDMYCTNQPNQLAIKIQTIKSGFLPLPLSAWADQIAEGFTEAGIPMTWSQSDATPVALIALPTKLTDDATRRIKIENIELHDGDIRLAGRSEPVDVATNQDDKPSWASADDGEKLIR